MRDFLSLPGSDLQTAIAAAAALAAVAATLGLFSATLMLRFATLRRGRRRRGVVACWRDVFTAAMLSAREARERELPRCARSERGYVLEEWNSARAAVEGEAVANLVAVAGRIGLDAWARAMLRRRRLGSKLVAIQTLGHLGDASEWSTLAALAEHPNTALSATAALALVQIDVREGLPLVMTQVVARTDWPPTSVSRILKTAGAARITQPLCNAILTSDAATSVRLLRYAELARTETVDQLVELLLRERDEPAVLAAALSAASSQSAVPRLASLACHEAWYVRVQAANVIGRVGDERDVPLLEGLLADAVWWVRYRAAQALVSLPFLGPNRLRQIRNRQTDRFAADIMQQAMAETGLT